MYINNQTSISNCSFVNNSASQYGGAFYQSSGSLGVVNCSFVNNSASASGGAILHGSGSLGVVNCSFVNNSAYSAASGAIYHNSGSLGVVNCSFVNNSASTRGGAIFHNSGSLGVVNCSFVNNSASTSGGAICFTNYNGGGSVNNSIFIGNIASTGSAIYMYNTASNNISNSYFLNNRANSTSVNITNEDGLIHIVFVGEDNWINAIYSDVDINFDNVTYWGVNGVMNTDSGNLVNSFNESGQNITIRLYVNGDVVFETTEITDINGSVVFDPIYAGGYTVEAIHLQDSYYTGVNSSLFVPKINFTLDVVVSPGKDIYNIVVVNVSVVVPVDFDGNVTVDVNGTSVVVPVVDGNGSVVIPLLPG